MWPVATISVATFSVITAQRTHLLLTDNAPIVGRGWLTGPWMTTKMGLSVQLLMDIIFETLDDLRTSSHHCDPDFQLRAYHLTYWASGCFRMQLNYTDIADILLYTFPCTVYCLY